MTIHAPSDVRSVTIPTTRGGCGQPHQAGDLAAGEHMTVTCPQCEPVLLTMKGHGWASDPLHIGLTCDERAAAAAIREKNEAAQQRAVANMSTPEGFAGFLRAAGLVGTQVAQVPGDVQAQMDAMQEQIAQLVAQNAELAAKVAGRDTDPAPKPTPEPVPEPAPAPEPVKATKRAPKKTAPPAAEPPAE